MSPSNEKKSKDAFAGGTDENRTVIKYPSEKKILEDLKKKNISKENINEIYKMATNLGLKFNQIGFMCLNAILFMSFEDWCNDLLMVDEGSKEKVYNFKFAHQGRPGDEPTSLVKRQI